MVFARLKMILLQSIITHTLFTKVSSNLLQQITALLSTSETIDEEKAFLISNLHHLKLG